MSVRHLLPVLGGTLQRRVGAHLRRPLAAASVASTSLVGAVESIGSSSSSSSLDDADLGAPNELRQGSNVQGLQAFSKKELLFLVDHVASARVSDRSVWQAYASRLVAEAHTLSLNEICAVLHCLSLVEFPKPSLLNILVKRLNTDTSQLQPWQLASVLESLQRLGHSDGRLLLALVNNQLPSMQVVPSDALPLLLTAFAAAAYQHKRTVAEATTALVQRAPDIPSAGIARACMAIAALDCGTGEVVADLMSRILPRRIVDLDAAQLLRLAVSLAMLDFAA